MTIRMLRETPPPELAAKLEEFESAFTYLLGPGRSFRISHSPDYTRFYRAMGNAACFIAEQGDRVTGTLSVAIRELRVPDGSCVNAAYIGDLKTLPDARSSRVLLRLAQAADEWARPQVTVAYGVVMDGTAALPEEYSGRAGIERFEIVGRIVVLRIATESALQNQQSTLTPVSEVCPKSRARNATTRLFGHTSETGVEWNEGSFHQRLGHLAPGKFLPLGGELSTRSILEPRWLIAVDGSAIGVLEDTRKAKRLSGNDGIEMVSAHLGSFAFASPESAVTLIRDACDLAKSAGFPALFTAVPASEFAALNNALGPIERVIAPATIYGAGMKPGSDWIINTSEI